MSLYPATNKVLWRKFHFKSENRKLLRLNYDEAALLRKIKDCVVHQHSPAMWKLISLHCILSLWKPWNWGEILQHKVSENEKVLKLFLTFTYVNQACFVALYIFIPPQTTYLWGYVTSCHEGCRHGTDKEHIIKRNKDIGRKDRRDFMPVVSPSPIASRFSNSASSNGTGQPPIALGKHNR